MSLTLSNLLDSGTAYCNVTIVGGINDVKVTDHNMAATVNQSKSFNISFASTSHQSCIQVTPYKDCPTVYAYGHDPSVCTQNSHSTRRKRNVAPEMIYVGSLNNPQLYEYTYNAEGMYTMSVLGFDAYEPEEIVTADFTFAITERVVDCSRPVVAIKNNVTDPQAAVAIQASKKITFQAEVSAHFSLNVRT